jgi:hypothetical protein
MTGGAEMSARERASERAGAAGLACWAARVARPSKCGRGRERAGRPRGWAEPEGERRSRPEMRILFFFF